MKSVFVIDENKTVLEPCRPATARYLLNKGDAAVWNLRPFTIILKRCVSDVKTKEYTLGIDPGSKKTGLAVTGRDNKIVFKAVLVHRGETVKKNLARCSNFRRGRRTRNLRYRPSRWANRVISVPTLVDNEWCYVRVSYQDKLDNSKTKNTFNRVSKAKLMDKRYKWERLSDTKANRKSKKRWKRVRTEYKRRFQNGWVAPSMMHRVFNIETWVRRIRKICPITDIAFENVKFDTQLMTNPDISGIEYSQGELFGYELREYLLEKFNRKCYYCNTRNTALQIEHILPKGKGGSSRIDNLTIACHECNTKKANKMPHELDEPMAQKVKNALVDAKKSLRDASAVNTIRWKIYETLKATGLYVFCGSGGRTKYNRTQAGLSKTDYYDASCIDRIAIDTDVNPLYIKSIGYGTRDNLGFIFKMLAPGFKKHYKNGGRIVSCVLPDTNQRLIKGDYVWFSNKNGKYEGYINCFDYTKKGFQKLRVTENESGYRRSARVNTITKKRSRDGYACFHEENVI